MTVIETVTETMTVIETVTETMTVTFTVNERVAVTNKQVKLFPYPFYCSSMCPQKDPWDDCGFTLYETYRLDMRRLHVTYIIIMEN